MQSALSEMVVLHVGDFFKASDHDDLITADNIDQQQDVNIQPKATHGTISDLPWFCIKFLIMHDINLHNTILNIVGVSIVLYYIVTLRWWDCISIVDIIIPTNLVCVLFGPAIPT